MPAFSRCHQTFLCQCGNAIYCIVFYLNRKSDFDRRTEQFGVLLSTSCKIEPTFSLSAIIRNQAEQTIVCLTFLRSMNLSSPSTKFKFEEYLQPFAAMQFVKLTILCLSATDMSNLREKQMKNNNDSRV